MYTKIWQNNKWNYLLNEKDKELTECVVDE